MNLRPPAPKAGALPGCATPRPVRLYNLALPKSFPRTGLTTVATRLRRVKLDLDGEVFQAGSREAVIEHGALRCECLLQPALSQVEQALKLGA